MFACIVNMVRSLLLACHVFIETNILWLPSGIVKTHRLVLQTPSSQLHLHAPEALNESHVVIGPIAMRDMIDHFPSTRGKADPQLIWVFDDTEVHVRSFGTSLDSKGAVNITSAGMHVEINVRRGWATSHRTDYQRRRV